MPVIFVTTSLPRNVTAIYKFLSEPWHLIFVDPPKSVKLENRWKRCRRTRSSSTIESQILRWICVKALLFLFAIWIDEQGHNRSHPGTVDPANRINAILFSCIQRVKNFLSRTIVCIISRKNFRFYRDYSIVARNAQRLYPLFCPRQGCSL